MYVLHLVLNRGAIALRRRLLDLLHLLLDLLLDLLLLLLLLVRVWCIALGLLGHVR